MEKKIRFKKKPSNDNTLTQTLTIHIVYGVWHLFRLARLKLQLHTQKRIYTLKRRLIINETHAINEIKIISILNPKCLFHFRFLFWVSTTHFQEKVLRRTFWGVYKKAMRWAGKFLNYFRCDQESHWRNVLSWHPVLFLICQSQCIHPHLFSLWVHL